jgi:predicted DNA binding CopG/RHH family protein
MENMTKSVDKDETIIEAMKKLNLKIDNRNFYENAITVDNQMLTTVKE